MPDPNFVILYVDSPGASAAFYADLLGMARGEARPASDIFDFSLVAAVNRELDASGWTPQR